MQVTINTSHWSMNILQLIQSTGSDHQSTINLNQPENRFRHPSSKPIPHAKVACRALQLAAEAVRRCFLLCSERERVKDVFFLLFALA